MIGVITVGLGLLATTGCVAALIGHRAGHQAGHRGAYDRGYIAGWDAGQREREADFRGGMPIEAIEGFTVRFDTDEQARIHYIEADEFGELDISVMSPSGRERLGQLIANSNRPDVAP